MKLLTYSCLLLVVGIPLSACREEMTPITSGSVYYHATERVLSSEQLQSLSVWMERGSSGWRRCFATPPSSSLLSISLKHANGKVSSLRLLSYENSKTTMEARYLSGSNLSEQPCALQSFSEKEISDLRVLLGVEP